MARNPSLSAVRATLAETAPDMVIRKDDSGEYRVTFSQAAIARAFPAMTRPELIAKAESLAAYESDICDAYETAKAMYRTGLSAEAPAALPPLFDESVSVDALAPSPEGRELARPLAEITGEPEAPAVQVIDMTPTWAAILPLLRAGIENGTPEGRRIAGAELARMAALADERNALASAEAEREAESVYPECAHAPAARTLGAHSFDCGLPRSANPFAPESEARESWDSGFDHAASQWRAAKRADVADAFGDAAGDLI